MKTTLIAGVDEVGRGPLAGPVVAAAVVLGPDVNIPGLTDSKKLSEKKRLQLTEQIYAQAKGWAIAEVSVADIDRINIFQASLLAMKLAIEKLTVTVDEVLVDGKFCPDIQLPARAIIQGDLTVPEISAASIIAKTYRDNLLVKLGEQYPEYGFAQHKGYPTRQHIAALQQHGVTDIHRRSYKPVQKILAGG